MERHERQMQFVFSLRSNGVTNSEVLTVMEEMHRENFLDGVFQERAFEDTPLPISCGQTISQPSIVGLMTQALSLTRRCKVLEIGTGSGYQAAILSKLSRRVYTVERHRRLARRSKELLHKLNLHNITVVHGDGSMGLPEQAPFDRILLTAAAEDPPRVLLDQLRPGGIMVLPVGQSDSVQTLIRVEHSENGFDYTDLGAVRFVPLVEGVEHDVLEYKRSRGEYDDAETT